MIDSISGEEYIVMDLSGIYMYRDRRNKSLMESDSVISDQMRNFCDIIKKIRIFFDQMLSIT